MLFRNLKRFSGKVLRQPLYATKVAGKRAKAYLSYHVGQGKAGYPEAITLFLTYRCNLRCKMCGQWGESGVTRNRSGENVPRDMSFDELKKLVDDIAFFKPNITLFGGEPLMHRHAPDIIRYIKDKGLHCLMITNGSLLNKLAREVVESRLDELNVSIDGAGALHDEIRGMHGLYEKISGGLKEVARLKMTNKMKKPLVNLQCTINRDNYTRLDQMIDVAKEVQADSLTFHNLIFVSPDMMEKQREFDTFLNCSSASWEGFVFEPSINVDLLYAKMEEIMNSPSNIPIDFYPNFSHACMKDYYQNPRYLHGKDCARCISPWMAAYVFPDGELRPCLNFDYAFGNVTIHAFSQLWNNERAVTFRRTLMENRKFPACGRCTELYRY